MSSNTRNAGLSEPSEAKVVSQGIDTDEMNRHHLIDQVQSDKRKVLLNKMWVSVYSSVLRMEP